MKPHRCYGEHTGACEGPVLLYAGGAYCHTHNPHPPPLIPDPARTMDGLRTAAGIRAGAFTPPTETVSDDRAIVSGKRRSTPQEFADAKARENERRTR